jgi:hypothetical protein
MGLLGLQHSATAGQTGSWQAIDTIFPNATPRCDTVAIGQSVAKVSTHLLVAQGCRESVLLLLDAAVMPRTTPDCAPPIA